MEDFLQDELDLLHATPDTPDAQELRLQAHRGAFDLFISHFPTYGEPLSKIKQEYESQIASLRAELAVRTTTVPLPLAFANGRSHSSSATPCVDSLAHSTSAAPAHALMMPQY